MMDFGGIQNTMECIKGMPRDEILEGIRETIYIDNRYKFLAERLGSTDENEVVCAKEEMNSALETVIENITGTPGEKQYNKIKERTLTLLLANHTVKSYLYGIKNELQKKNDNEIIDFAYCCVKFKEHSGFEYVFYVFSTVSSLKVIPLNNEECSVENGEYERKYYLTAIYNDIPYGQYREITPEEYRDIVIRRNRKVLTALIKDYFN